MHVLVVEDDIDAAMPLVDGLRRHGHETTAVRSGAEALDEYDRAELVLLDLGLPDIDGLEVCRRMRSLSDTPIITFTERYGEVDVILGLQAGSDDCLGKPYAFRELIARMEAVMRRAGMRRPCGVPDPTLFRGPLRIDIASREVKVADKVVEVTRKEFDLLHYLASRPGVVVSRQRLMAEVWGHPESHALGVQASRTIDTHVSALRAKLGDSSSILTVRGIGFRWHLQGGAAAR
ncbi:response regulator transcription factor [Streptomyces sp. NPDC014894]|uniref:response regulator transcription factor n=1 Tax=unclassified Streptomyces TaxID=2593676 RepID=UPI0036FF94F9